MVSGSPASDDCDRNGDGAISARQAGFLNGQQQAAAGSSSLKQRRVSLALPQAPRVVEGWSFRDDTGLDVHAAESSLTVPRTAAPPRRVKTSPASSSPLTKAIDSFSDAGPSPKPEKKPRKKWSEAETNMLVEGCNKHGVGNWKTILRDPDLVFDDRSPVDLKDRFRTYFPDAYKKHYPNAKTHLSSKIRSTLPDGSSLFEKTRSKRRRPFTEAEDQALKDGYEKHGTVWATIVKDYPIFQEQNRRSTDLRDRFRNAFPDLYQAAGYKPRNAKKKVQPAVQKASVDDQQLSTGGPVRSRRRAHTNQGLLRGGTKSVPQSTACSEEDDSGSDSEPKFSPFKVPATPPSARKQQELPPSARNQQELPPSTPSIAPPLEDEDEEMNLITLDPLGEVIAFTDLAASHAMDQDDRGQWSSGINTPTHSNHWSTAAGSPTSSHLSSDLLNADASPFLQRHSNPNNNFGMIGKSAWGPDWFSPNPRLDPSSSAVQQSYYDHSSPASPFSFNHLNHGVLDRYDLFPSTLPTEISSEIGVGETHSTFSDDSDSLLFQGNRGFTHHSSSAGDLIFGTRSHHHNGYYSGLSSAAVSAIGGGFGSFGGLGLSLGAPVGAPFQPHENVGVHPMQLHSRTSAMVEGINDGRDGAPGVHIATSAAQADPLGVPLPPEAMDEDLDMPDDPSIAEQQQHQDISHQLHHLQMDDVKIEEMPASLAATTPSLMADQVSPTQAQFSMEEFVDLSNSLHVTPPATPLTQPRPLRRPMALMQQFPGLSSPAPSANGVHGNGSGGAGLHPRSISVPPSEFRQPMYVPAMGMMDPGYASALLDFDAGNGLQNQNIDFSGYRHIQSFHNLMAQQQQQQQQPTVSPVQRHLQPSPVSQGNGAMGQDCSSDSVGRRGRGRGRADDEEDDDHDPSDLRPQTPTLASRHLLSLPPATPLQTSLSNSSSSSSSSHSSISTTSSHSTSSSSLSSALGDDTWRSSFLSNLNGANGSSNAGNGSSTTASLAADIYNLPFLDLHYYGHGSGSGMMHSVGGGGGMFSTGGGDDFGGLADTAQMQQARALDLARSVSSSAASSSASTSSLFSPYLTSRARSPYQQQSQQQQHQVPQRPNTRLVVSSASLIQAFNGDPRRDDTTNDSVRGGGGARAGHVTPNPMHRTPSQSPPTIHAARASHPTTPLSPFAPPSLAKSLANGGSMSDIGGNPGSMGNGAGGRQVHGQQHQMAPYNKHVGLGRSHSHHRGQSASVSVNPGPQEVNGGGSAGSRGSVEATHFMRKRASWDGRSMGMMGVE